MLKKKIISVILSIVMITTIIQTAVVEPVNAQAADYTISNPRSSNGVVTWDCVWFGSHPQSKVNDITNDIKNASYNASGDAIVNGKKYRRVKESDAIRSSTLDWYYDWTQGGDESGYHYFVYEPIKWRVLSVEGNKALVISDKILDVNRYNDISSSITWEDCTLRQFLNETFYNRAFSTSEKEAIFNSNITNENNYVRGTYCGNDTVDKVFLLSLREATNQSHGFSTDCLIDDSRAAFYSDYGYAMGTQDSEHEKKGGWLLRTLGCCTNDVSIVDSNGAIGFGSDSVSGGEPIRPCICVDISSLTCPYAGTVNSDGTVNEVSSTYKTLPTNYSFDDDSYSFENYTASLISEKYFTTMYGEGAGKLLYDEMKFSAMGGLCFGYAYTTASILNGLPAYNRFENVGLFNTNNCTNLREIKKNSRVYIHDHYIKTRDFIKYAFIYQYSSSVQARRTRNRNELGNLKKQIEERLKRDSIGVTIDLFHCVNKNGNWENDSGHTVLAVGIDGNDILIDDPNNINDLERLTINNDGSWSYSGSWTSDGVNNSNSWFVYNTDYYRPYQVLLTGNVAAYDSEILDTTTESEEYYIEGMDILDSNNILLSVGGENYQIENENYVELLQVNSGNDLSSEDDDSRLYWIENDDKVSVNNIECNEMEPVKVAKGDVLLGVESSGTSNYQFIIDKEDCGINIETVNDSNVTFSYNMIENGQDSVIYFSGQSTDGVIQSELKNNEISINGLENIVAVVKDEDGSIKKEVDIKNDDNVVLNIDDVLNADTDKEPGVETTKPSANKAEPLETIKPGDNIKPAEIITQKPLGEQITTTDVAKKPARVTKVMAKNSKKKAIVVKYKKATNAKKYKIQYTTDKTFKKGVKTKITSKLTYTLKKLKKGEKYYVRVCAINGKLQGAWSAKKKVKIKIG